ncbi:hypothetical protein ACGFQG_20480 [Nocardia fluminea]|uniref:hypothetical protein n=1 Tax=Nocardia fluminea TaxID=134984 RepID=UPI00371CBEF5
MKTMIRAIAAPAVFFALLGIGAPTVSAASMVHAETVTIDLISQGLSCRAADNHGEVAAKFISRCKKGSVRSEFPSDRLSRTLGEIYAGKMSGDRDDVKAWKLLNDHRFDK